MGAPSVGEVVLVPFPFSDLSQTKLRPAMCLASAGRDDWVLCQITSNPFGDSSAVHLKSADFATGSLRIDSYARPGKLFTAHISLVAGSVGRLNQSATRRFLEAVTALFQPSVRP